MRRRPQPSVRRGLLRAAGAVVGLTIILLIIIFVVSTLTAPKAKAPTVPSTPTAGTPATVHTPTPGVQHTPTPGKKKSSMISGAALARRVLASHSALPANAVSSPSGRFILSFAPGTDAYSRTPLTLIDRSSGSRSTVGYGDALVRPVWSADGSRFLYVRVTRTTRFPGAAWQLVQGTRTGSSTILAGANALSMDPLGWSGGRALYIAATATDTSLYAARPGRAARFISIVFPQVVTAASLAPDGRSVAFSVPTGCSYCTVNVLRLDTFKTVYGPSFSGAETNLAWSLDGRTLVAGGAQGLSVLSLQDGSSRRLGSFTMPAGTWPRTMRASVTGSVRLTDTVTGATFVDKQ